MPITPAYTWQETETGLDITVSLPGCHRNKSDVFATECMIKVNLAPYLLVLDLHGEVDSTRTVATFLGRDAVQFKLAKSVPGLWHRLEAQGTKEELATRRNASVDKSHAEMEAARKARLERKQKEEKAAVDRQIELERQKRQYLEQRKAAELATERDSIADWKKQLGDRSTGQHGAIRAVRAEDGGDESDYEDDMDEQVKKEQQQNQEEEGKAMPDNPHYYGRGHWPGKDKVKSGSEQKHGSHGSENSDDDDDSEPAQDQSSDSVSSQHDTQDSEQNDQQISHAGSNIKGSGESSWRPAPPPRIRAEPVKISFTKTEFSHLPAREQREEELKVYKKQVAKDKASLADSNDVADRQPMFLKDKGDGLFKQGNYAGAIAAYNRAIELDESMPALWSNRAAAHGKQGNHQEAVEDCSMALQLLTARKNRYEQGQAEQEEIAGYKKQLVRAYVRRGASYAAMQQLEVALQDYQEASKYAPSDAAQLQADIQELQSALTPADLATLKARGAARFSAGDHIGAVQAFSAILALQSQAGPDCSDDHKLAALSNRAAVLLAMGDYARCEQDCCYGINLALHQWSRHINITSITSTSTSRDAAGTAVSKHEREQTTVGEDLITDASHQQAEECDGTEQQQRGGKGWHRLQQVVPSLADKAGAAWPRPADCKDLDRSWRVQDNNKRKGGVQQEEATVGSSVDGEMVDNSLYELICDVASCGDQSTGETQLPSSPESSSSSQAHEMNGAGAGTGHIAGGQHDDGVVNNGDVEGAWLHALVLGRLLARRAAARGHMRRYHHAAQDFTTAAHIMQLNGLSDKAEGLRQDALRMSALVV